MNTDKDFFKIKKLDNKLDFRDIFSDNFLYDIDNIYVINGIDNTFNDSNDIIIENSFNIIKHYKSFINISLYYDTVMNASNNEYIIHKMVYTNEFRELITVLNNHIEKNNEKNNCHSTLYITKLYYDLINNRFKCEFNFIQRSNKLSWTEN